MLNERLGIEVAGFADCAPLPSTEYCDHANIPVGIVGCRVEEPSPLSTRGALEELLTGLGGGG